MIYPTAAPRPGERWCATHQPEPIYPEDIPAEDCDVFEAVAAIEEDSLEFSNLNLNERLVMNQTQTPIAAAMIKAGVTHQVEAGTVLGTGHAYFDPLDVLEDKIGLHPVLHSRVLNSMAWMLDMSCINQARSILFNRYANAEHDMDDPFSNFCQGIAEDLSHDSLYDDESDERTLAYLLALRPQWHDAAQNAASSDDRDYNPKSLHQLLAEEKPRTASLGARMNLELIATKEARGDAAKKARLMAAFMQRDEIQALQRVDSNKKLIPTITAILDTVARYAPSDTRFDLLPELTQKRLTQFTLDTVERTLSNDVAKRSQITPVAFSRIVDAAYEATEALGKVIETKFSDKGELEYAGTPQTDAFNRRQKELASTV